MALNIQTILWITLGISFLINGAYAMFYKFQMHGSVKPEYLSSSMLIGWWWLDTEKLTDIGLQYRTKYLTHLFIGGLIMIVALFLWAYGELSAGA